MSALATSPAVAGAGRAFRRGDVTNDGCVNEKDAEEIVAVLFRGEGKFRCEDAADANNDNMIDNRDAIYILNFAESGGPPPPWPFPDCDYEANEPLDTLGCEEYNCNVACQSQPTFKRGDANGDGNIQLTDAVFTFFFLFVDSNNPPPCDDAADSNDTGRFELADGIFTLQYLFRGGPFPPAPGIECGIDETLDRLGCEQHFCFSG